MFHNLLFFPVAVPQFIMVMKLVAQTILEEGRLVARIPNIIEKSGTNIFPLSVLMIPLELQ